MAKIELRGNVPNLLIALEAVLSIPAKNFDMRVSSQGAFAIEANGRCNDKNNAANWLAQHPHFKTLGVRLEATPAASGVVSPIMDVESALMPGQNLRLRGLSVLSRVLGLDHTETHKIFSPIAYDVPKEVTPPAVAKRIRAAITKSGGRDALKAWDKALNAHVKANLPKTPAAKKGSTKSK